MAEILGSGRGRLSESHGDHDSSGFFFFDRAKRNLVREYETRRREERERKRPMVEISSRVSTEFNLRPPSTCLRYIRHFSPRVDDGHQSPARKQRLLLARTRKRAYVTSVRARIRIFGRVTRQRWQFVPIGDIVAVAESTFYVCARNVPLSHDSIIVDPTEKKEKNK